MPVTRKRKSKGGKPLASGTYGCVFKPALKCKKHTTRTSGISKLMMTKHMNTEMNLINTVKGYTDAIPHHKKYFLVDDITTCTPEYVTGSDLDNFNEVCFGLVKKGITSDTLNKRLKDLKIINIPYGGMELLEYFHQLERTKNRNHALVGCNNACIDLLVKAIVPLNTRGFLHNDIKYDNILFGDDLHARLIDYGLGSTFDPNQPRMPESLTNFSLAYNKPFSSILLQSEDSLNNLLAKFTTNKARAENVLMSKLKTSKGHHDKIIKTWMPAVLGFVPNIVVHDGVNTDATADLMITEYITTVLNKYYDSSARQFRSDAFFSEVYRHNADIWGYLTIYFAFFKRGKYWSTPFLDEIKRIVKKYCYSLTFAVTPIPIAPLEIELRHLNTLLEPDAKPSNAKPPNAAQRSTVRSKSISRFKSISRTKSGTLRSAR